MTREQVEAQRMALEALPHTQAKAIALELLAHIAALEKERDAANARLQMEIQQTKAVADALSDAAKETSALRLERDAAIADNAAVRLKLSQAADGYNSREFWDSVDALRGTAHPGTALLEEHRKALVRARNEGLEMAAKHFDEEANRWAGTHAATIALQNAHAIRSRKEPEQ